MLITVVLGGHHVFLPAHVEHANVAPAVDHRNLRRGDWQAGVDQQQPQPGLLGRRGAAINKGQHVTQPADTSGARVTLGQ